MNKINCTEFISAFKQNETNNLTKVAEKFGISRQALYHRMKICNLCRRAKFNEKYFESIDTEEKAYWLGFIMADGCIVDTQSSLKLAIKLSSKDENHLINFHKHIKSYMKINKKTATTGWSKNHEYVYSTHISNKMCNDLISHGCIPRKSLFLKFPDIKKSLERHFIRGYIDGDGCIRFHKNKKQKSGGLRITILGTKEFLEKIQNIFNTNLGISFKKIKLKGNVNRFDISGYKDAKNICNWLYNNTTLFLQRKYEIYSKVM